jgi:hypothetical protein
VCGQTAHTETQAADEETTLQNYAAFLRRRTYTARRPDGGWRAAAARGRGQLARQEDGRAEVVQRVVSRRARPAPQEGHESRQTQPTHRVRLQRDVDEQNGNRNGTVSDNACLPLCFSMSIIIYE